MQLLGSEVGLPDDIEVLNVSVDLSQPFNIQEMGFDERIVVGVETYIKDSEIGKTRAKQKEEAVLKNIIRIQSGVITAIRNKIDWAEKNGGEIGTIRMFLPAKHQHMITKLELYFGEYDISIVKADSVSRKLDKNLPILIVFKKKFKGVG